METLGSLCDKITIIKLKQYHSKDKIILATLFIHENLVKKEINDFIALAIKRGNTFEKIDF